MLRTSLLALIAAAGPSQDGSINYIECKFDKTQMTFGFSEKAQKVIDVTNPNISFSGVSIKKENIAFRSSNRFY